jgi:hypothetical protein
LQLASDAKFHTTLELAHITGVREAEGGADSDADADIDTAVDDTNVYEEKVVFGRGLFCHEWITKVGSLIGGAFLLAAIITGSVGNPDIFDFKNLWHLWIMAGTFQPMGTFFGYTLAAAFGLGPKDMRAVGIETGVQSYALVISVISTSFTGCERDQILTFPLIAGFWYSINSLGISLLMRFCVSPCDKYFDRSHIIRCGSRCFCGERDRIDVTERPYEADHPLHAGQLSTHPVCCPPSRKEVNHATFVLNQWTEYPLFAKQEEEEKLKEAEEENDDGEC